MLENIFRPQEKRFQYQLKVNKNYKVRKTETDNILKMVDYFQKKTDKRKSFLSQSG